MMNFKNDILTIFFYITIISSKLLAEGIAVNVAPISDIEAERKFQEMLQNKCPCIIPKLAGIFPDEICNIIYCLEQSKNPKTSEPYQNFILLYGPPGTGKTETARAIAEKAGAKFIDRAASSFVTSFQGSGAENVKSLFEEIEDLLNAGETVVVFIDEIDALCKERTDKSSHDQAGGLQELLVKIEEYTKRPQVVIVAATNKIEYLDEALRKRSIEIEIPAPNVEQCAAIFIYYLNQYSHNLHDKIPNFAQQAYDRKFVGRDIAHLVHDAFIESKKSQEQKGKKLEKKDVRVVEGAINQQMIKREKIRKKELKDWEENKGQINKERELVRKQLEQVKTNVWNQWKQDNWDVIMYLAYKIWQDEGRLISYQTIWNPIKWFIGPYNAIFSYSIPIEKINKVVENIKIEFEKSSTNEFTILTDKLRQKMKCDNQETVAYILRDNVEKKSML